MRGISEERLNEIVKISYEIDTLLGDYLRDVVKLNVKELNPWMTLEEFLKSGFVGLCFVLINGVVEEARFYGHTFAITQRYGTIKAVDKYQATRVMPIHKPEPPR